MALSVSELSLLCGMHKVTQQRLDIEIYRHFGDYFVTFVGIQAIRDMDFVKAEDVNLHHDSKNHNAKVDPKTLHSPLCWGIDGKQRAFIIIKVDYSMEGKIVQIAIVFFKKHLETENVKNSGIRLKCPVSSETAYVRSENLFVSSLRNKGSDKETYLTPYKIRGKEGMTPDQLQLLVDLIDGKQIDLDAGNFIRKSRP